MFKVYFLAATVVLSVAACNAPKPVQDATNVVADRHAQLMLLAGE